MLNANAIEEMTAISILNKLASVKADLSKKLFEINSIASIKDRLLDLRTLVHQYLEGLQDLNPLMQDLYKQVLLSFGEEAIGLKLGLNKDLIQLITPELIDDIHRNITKRLEENENIIISKAKCLAPIEGNVQGNFVKVPLPTKHLQPKELYGLRVTFSFPARNTVHTMNLSEILLFEIHTQLKLPPNGKSQCMFSSMGINTVTKIPVEMIFGICETAPERPDKLPIRNWLSYETEFASTKKQTLRVPHYIIDRRRKYGLMIPFGATITFDWYDMYGNHGKPLKLGQNNDKKENKEEAEALAAASQKVAPLPEFSTWYLHDFNCSTNGKIFTLKMIASLLTKNEIIRLSQTSKTNLENMNKNVNFQQDMLKYAMGLYHNDPTKLAYLHFPYIQSLIWQGKITANAVLRSIDPSQIAALFFQPHHPNNQKRHDLRKQALSKGIPVADMRCGWFEQSHLDALNEGQIYEDIREKTGMALSLQRAGINVNKVALTVTQQNLLYWYQQQGRRSDEIRRLLVPIQTMNEEEVRDWQKLAIAADALNLGFTLNDDILSDWFSEQHVQAVKRGFSVEEVWGSSTEQVTVLMQVGNRALAIKQQPSVWSSTASPLLFSRFSWAAKEQRAEISSVISSSVSSFSSSNNHDAHEEKEEKEEKSDEDNKASP